MTTQVSFSQIQNPLHLDDQLLQFTRQSEGGLGVQVENITGTADAYIKELQAKISNVEAQWEKDLRLILVRRNLAEKGLQGLRITLNSLANEKSELQSLKQQRDNTLKIFKQIYNKYLNAKAVNEATQSVTTPQRTVLLKQQVEIQNSWQALVYSGSLRSITNHLEQIEKDQKETASNEKKFAEELPKAGKEVKEAEAKYLEASKKYGSNDALAASWLKDEESLKRQFTSFDEKSVLMKARLENLRALEAKLKNYE